MKYVVLFPKGGTDALQQAEKSLREEGIEKVHSQSLSHQAQSEVDQEVFISRRERSWTWLGMLAGLLLGLVLAYLQVADLLYFPWLLPIFAAGEVGVYIFWAVLWLMIGGLVGALAGLLWGVTGVGEGEQMMVLYAPANQRRHVARLVHDFGGHMV